MRESSIVKMNYRSRLTLWAVEGILALNVIYLSGAPLLKDGLDQFNTNGVVEGLETFLTGSGPYTAAFWLRIVAVLAGFAILLTWPRKKSPKKYLRIRVYSDFMLFILYFYVFTLGLIFGQWENYFWVQPLVYSSIMGVAYMSNSWRLHRD
jgi:hypothetical protein